MFLIDLHSNCHLST